MYSPRPVLPLVDTAGVKSLRRTLSSTPPAESRTSMIAHSSSVLALTVMSRGSSPGRFR